MGLKGISRMEIELGMKLRAPMTETMVLTLLTILINRGLKTRTMHGYICAMYEDHNFAKAILRGKSNMASSRKEERAETR